MRILAALLALLSLHCAAAPVAVRIGPERVVLDAPPGFSDTTELASPRLQEMAESQTSASNRILMFALTDADVRRFMAGDQIEARRYAVVVTPRGAEGERAGAQALGAFVADAMRELGRGKIEGDLFKFLDGQPHGKSSLVAELRKDAVVVSLLQGTRLPQVSSGRFFTQEKPAQYLFVTHSVLLLRGKLLRLDLYASLEAAADVEWLKGVTERWIGDLIRLNAR